MKGLLALNRFPVRESEDIFNEKFENTKDSNPATKRLPNSDV